MRFTWKRAIQSLSLVAMLASCLAGAVRAEPPTQAPVPLPQAAEDAQATSSPRASVRAYLEACRTGDFAVAARELDLGSVPAEDRATVGSPGTELEFAL